MSSEWVPRMARADAGDHSRAPHAVHPSPAWSQPRPPAAPGKEGNICSHVVPVTAMVVTQFPPVEHADPDGLLAFGGDFEVESLLCAYRSGIFPWPLGEGTLAWFAPPSRAVLNFDAFHLPRSLKKVLRRGSFRCTVNRAFADVIEGCARAENRSDRNGTWITNDLKEGYIALHSAGYAHSLEVWHEGALAGGIYGVMIGSYFSAESMFYRISNASKVALYELVTRLQATGLTWIDVQVLTPTTETFGAHEIPREEFMEWLRGALATPCPGLR